MRLAQGLCIALLVGPGVGDSAIAQNLVLDGTLGPAGPLQGPNYIVEQDLGQTVGDNLFHSFERFDLDRFESASFRSDANIQNIFTRVTGWESFINGTILSPDANFFLLNPFGIVFGPNARLNLGQASQRSFVATTFDEFVWANGGTFNGFDPNPADSLLTLQGMPVGAFGAVPRLSPIRLDSTDLALDPGENISLLGGNIFLDDVTIEFSENQLQFAAAGGVGMATLQSAGQGIRFELGNLPRAEIELNETFFDNADIDPEEAQGGQIEFVGRSIQLTDSFLLAIASDSRDTNNPGGITLDATETIRLNGTDVRTELNSDVSGNNSPILIQAAELIIENGSAIGSTAIASGKASDVNITANQVVIQNGRAGIVSGAVAEQGGESGDINIAADNLKLHDDAVILTFVQGGRDNQSGDVNIAANSLQLRDNANIFTSVFEGQNNQAGDINIEVAGEVSISGLSGELPDNDDVFNLFGDFDNASGELGPINGIGSFVLLADGKGGNVNIAADSFSLTKGSGVSTVVLGLDTAGAAGNVVLQTQGDLVIDGQSSTINSTGVFSRVVAGAGSGGNVSLSAGGEVRIQNGGFLNSVTVAENDAGDISILAQGNLQLIGGNVNSSSFGSGDAGDITLRSTEGTALFIGNPELPGGIVASLVGNAEEDSRGGTIQVQARDIRFENGFGLFTLSGGRGNAGDVQLIAENDISLNIAGIWNSAYGGGDSGRVSIVAGDSVTFNESVVFGGVASFGSLVAALETQGNSVPAEVAELSPDALLRGTGRAELIEIDANSIQLENDSLLLTSAIASNGGDIRLNARNILALRTGSRIQADSRFDSDRIAGNGGNINISAPFILAVPREDSDITTNAQRGRGGNINITTQGLFGIEFRPKQTPLSDITASSEFGLDGTFTLDGALVEPTQDLAELPGDLGDRSDQIAVNCSSETLARGELVLTGRGGLPLSPGEVLLSHAADADWANLASSASTTVAASTTFNQQGRSALREAQAWAIGSSGQVQLLAGEFPAQAGLADCARYRKTSLNKG